MRKMRWRKVMAVWAGLLIGILLLPASAAAQTEDRPESGDLTIHRYTQESYTTGEWSSDGSKITDGLENAVPIIGIEYTIFQVDTSSGVPEDVSEASEHLISGTSRSAVTDSNGQAVFKDLTAGCYYMKESSSWGREPGMSADQSYLPTADFLVMVPMEKVDGSGWNTDVHVYPKAESLVIDKYVNNAGTADPDFTTIKTAKDKPVAVGETFGWTIEASIPGDIGEDGKGYVITDEMTEVFSFSADTIKVYSVTARDMATASANILTENEHYSVEILNNGFKIYLTDAGRAFLAERSEDKLLRIKFDAVLLDEAENGVAHYNGATVTYSTTNAETGAVNEINRTVTYEPEVHTGQIKVYKMDAEDNSILLAKAEFALAESEEAAKTGEYLAIGTTDLNGELKFSGLSYGAVGDGADENSSNTTFWVVELTAPEGYEELSAPFKVTFDHHFNVNDNAYYFAEADIYNQKISSDTPQDPGSSDSKSPGTSSSGKSVKTGDISLPVLALAAALIVSGIIIFHYYRKRRQLQ